MPVSFFWSEEELVAVRGGIELCRIHWSSIAEFSIKQIGQSFMQLVIKTEQGKVLDINLPLPAHSMGTSQLLEQLDIRVSPERSRYYKLLRPGVSWQMKPIHCKYMIGIGAALAVPIPLGGVIALWLMQYLPKSIADSIGLLSDGTLAIAFFSFFLGIGLLIYGWGSLRQLRKPIPEDLGKEPIIFSKQSRFSTNRMAFIFQLGLEAATVAFLTIFVGLFLGFTYGFSFSLTGIIAMSGLTGLMYLPFRFQSRDFESVILTEGRIVVKRSGRLLLDAYILDCSANLNPKNRSQVIFKTGDKSVIAHNHKVSGELLLDVYNRLKSGEKITPLLSEDHPGFRIRFNDEQPPGV